MDNRIPAVLLKHENNKSPLAINRLNSLLEYEKNLIKCIEEKEKVSEERCLYGEVFQNYQGFLFEDNRRVKTAEQYGLFEWKLQSNWSHCYSGISVGVINFIVSSQTHELKVDVKALESKMDVNLKSLESKMDSQTRELKVDVKALESKMDVKFESIETKMTAIQKSVDDLNWVVRTYQERQTDQGERLVKLESKDIK